MKKLLFTIILSISFLFIGIDKAYAATATISTTANRSTVTVGYSVNVTVTVSSSAPLGSWEFVVNYDSSKLKLTSTTSPTYVVDVAANSSTTSKSYSYSFKALKAGSTSVSISNYAVLGWDENLMTTSTSKKYLTLANPVVIVLSDNNNLKSLTSDIGNLEPEFDKDETEYTINVDELIDNITLTATKDQEDASVTGDGELPVSEGANLFPIKVIAENGDEKTYNVTVNVIDKNPINVTLDDEEYTVLKKSGTLDIPDNYQETTIAIKSVEVAAYESDLNELLLVGLKDSSGVSNLYVYDSNEESYKLYNEFTLSNVVLYLYEPDKEVEIPYGYKDISFKIGESDINGYKLDNMTNYYLVYGMNIESGNEDFYVYDKDENTFQRFDNTQALELKKKLEEYKLIIIAFGAIITFTLIALIIILVKYIKFKRKIEKVKQRKIEKIKNEAK